MNQYHEPIELLDEETRNQVRAFRSLIEELEAVDWYNQRMNATNDSELRSILKHNRDEEMEHAAMTLEWLRRRIPELDAELKENLFTEGEIGHHHEDENESRPSKMSIGSMKNKEE
ncbi:MAG: encapsulin-associated ferritin-like protein [Candidatus Izemoplasmataceae bacterium]